MSMGFGRGRVARPQVRCIREFCLQVATRAKRVNAARAKGLRDGRGQKFRGARLNQGPLGRGSGSLHHCRPASRSAAPEGLGG